MNFLLKLIGYVFYILIMTIIFDTMLRIVVAIIKLIMQPFIRKTKPVTSYYKTEMNKTKESVEAIILKVRYH